MYSELQTALKILAAKCDGAHSWDGHGFNKIDAYRGKMYAHTDLSLWNDDIAAKIYVMLRKYKKQLASSGFDYDAVTAPTIKPKRRVELFGNVNKLQFIYEFNKEIYPKVNSIPGAFYSHNTKLHIVTANSATYDKIMALVEEYDFSVADDVLERIDCNKDVKPDGTKEQPKIIRTVDLREGRLLFVNKPYDEQIKEVLKGISNRKWDEQNKGWSFEIVFNNLNPILDAIVKFSFIVSDEARRVLEAAVAKYARVQQEPGEILVELAAIKLKKFQMQGVYMMYHNQRFVLADDMGSGKTVQAIATVMHVWLNQEESERRPVIIICPKKVMGTWKNEWRKADPFVIPVMWTTKDSDISSDVVIVNYDIIGKVFDKLCALGADTIIFDEAHKLRNNDTDRFENCLRIADTCSRRYALTGTPVHNHATDIFNILRVIGVEREFGGTEAGFHRRYEYDRYQLHRDLKNAGVYLRREKSEILPQLTTLWTTLDWKLTNQEEYNEAENNFINWVAKVYGDESANRAMAAFALVYIAKMRQLSARGKIESAVQWIQEMMSDGESLVVFGWHNDVIHEVARRCGGAVIDGKTKDSQQIVRDFANRKIRLVVLSIPAAGEGIDGLQHAASTCLFLEQAWTASAMEQAKDRLERIGQLNEVDALLAIAPRTIDMYMAKIVLRKKILADEIVSGKTETDPDKGIAVALMDWAYAEAGRRGMIR